MSFRDRRFRRMSGNCEAAVPFISNRVVGWLWGLGLIVASFQIAAEAPKFEQFFPAGGARGTTNSLLAVGKFEPWPVDVWIDSPGVMFRPEKEAGKFNVEIAPDAALGVRLVRFSNKEGATELRFFVVTARREVPESEPNDDWTRAQPVPALPATLNGRLEKNGDVDSFAVTLEAGQWLVASLDAYRLASPMDGLLRILDATGRQVAFNHDARSLDPFLAWKAVSPGTYTVQLMAFPHPATASVNFAGGGAYVYRLALTTGPFASHTMPLATRVGQRQELQAFGWNFPGGASSILVDFDAPKSLATDGECWVESGAFLSPIRAGLSEDPQILEAALKNDASGVRDVTVPCGISGCVSVPGEEDRYRFNAKKGSRIEFVARSGWFGFPLDSSLRVLDGQGKELARDDDGGGWGDPRIDWTVPAEGDYTAVLGSLTGRGGGDFLYHLSIGTPKPSVRATVADNTFSIVAGKTNEIKVIIERRNGFECPYVLQATGLPEGLGATPVEVGEKAKEAVMRLTAPEGATLWNGSFALVLRPPSGPEIQVVDELISTSVNNGVPGGFLDLVIPETPHLWLSVLPKPVEAPPKK